MEKNTEKRIEEKLGKELTEEIKKEVDKEVKIEVEKKIEKEVSRIEREIKKLRKIPSRVYEETIGTAKKYKDEFRNQIIIAITAAFAFLIALSWRTPIEGLVNLLIERLGLSGQAVYVQFISAIIITIIAVIVLVIISKWKSNEEIR